jgi:putative transcriptional regulator
VFAGYAGWAPGQLAGEVARGDWLVFPADETSLFTVDAAGQWDSLIRRRQ